jgi:hypothetical protein
MAQESRCWKKAGPDLRAGRVHPRILTAGPEVRPYPQTLLFDASSETEAEAGAETVIGIDRGVDRDAF